MRFKEKFAGILLIVIGALPLLLKIKSFSDAYSKSTFLTWLVPGDFFYQFVLIALGIILIWEGRYSRFRRY